MPPHSTLRYRQTIEQHEFIVGAHADRGRESRQRIPWK